MVPVWGPVDSLWQAVLSFHHVSPGEQTLVNRIGGKCHYPLNHPASPLTLFLIRESLTNLNHCRNL